MRLFGLALIAAAVEFGFPARAAETLPIADTSQGFFSFHAFAINENGVAALIASKLDPVTGAARRGVYKGSEAGVTAIATEAAEGPRNGYAFNLIGDRVSINAAGTVGFVAVRSFTQGGSELFAETGVFTGLPQQDTVAGIGTILNRRETAFVAQDGSFAFGNGISVFGFVSPSHPSGFLRSDVQDGHVLAFDKLPGRGYVFLYISRGANGHGTSVHRVVVDPTAPQPEDFFVSREEWVVSERLSRVHSLAMNRQGNFALIAQEGFDLAGVLRVMRSAGSALAVLAQTAPAAPSASEFDLRGDQTVSIDDAGQVTFSARSRTLGRDGIFRGLNPAADRLVVVGDAIAPEADAPTIRG